jgi:hypothetical protein
MQASQEADCTEKAGTRDELIAQKLELEIAEKFTPKKIPFKNMTDKEEEEEEDEEEEYQGG